MRKAEDKISPGEVIARGAAGVAITAGVVAAGVMLADKKNRDRFGKSLQEGFKTVKEITGTITEEDRENYPAVAHRIAVAKNRRKKTQNKGGKRKAAGK